MSQGLAASRRAMASWRWWCVSLGLRPHLHALGFAETSPRRVVDNRHAPSLSQSYRSVYRPVARPSMIEAMEVSRWSVGIAPMACNERPAPQRFKGRSCAGFWSAPGDRQGVEGGSPLR